MKAYKFRGEDQIAFAFDIIFNDQLYCASWSNLNDPMEGHFVYSHDDSNRERVENNVRAIVSSKQEIRICSLSATFDCHLLWSHYASGFRGLAIEVELPETEHVREVEYRDIFGLINADGKIEPSVTARDILASKYKEWEYEQEVRVLHDEPYFRLASPVKHVIAGPRMEPALFKALNYMCCKKGIRFSRAVITDMGIIAGQVDPPEEANF